mgnify:CR=1 FL=1
MGKFSGCCEIDGESINIWNHVSMLTTCHIKKEFSKVLKIFSNEVKKSAQSMVKFNDNFLLKNDYLNFRNSLYTKDIEKQYLLVDTRNLCHCTETHSYEINFTTNTNNESGGYGVFKNVIGFRLNECIYTSPVSNITRYNNTRILLTLRAICLGLI